MTDWIGVIAVVIALAAVLVAIRAIVEANEALRRADSAEDVAHVAFNLARKAVDTPPPPARQPAPEPGGAVTPIIMAKKPKASVPTTNVALATDRRDARHKA
jgi:hypothetical protein